MKRKADPIDTMVECIEVFIEASYEDSEVSEPELKVAKRRFQYALQYIIMTMIEEQQGVKREKVKVQSNSSA